VPVFYTVEVDRLREQEPSYVLTSGDPLRPETNHEVKPGWPFVTAKPDLRDGRIEAFTDWLTAPENPLFARVAVNRLWQWHFGELGGKPSHPALLDWLASEFGRCGFSMKQIHRLMVTSETYKRASDAAADFTESQRIDPDDAMLWHFRLRRLEAEPIWDSIHAAAGDLDLTVGGPSFGLRDGGGGNRRRRDATVSASTNSFRRGAYIIRGYASSRDVTPNFLQAFDVDDGREPCPMRTRTVTPPQALFLMNSTEVDGACGVFASRLQKETGDLPSAVDLAYRLVLTRRPSIEETNSAIRYLENDPARLKNLAWLLFNLDEFVYVK